MIKILIKIVINMVALLVAAAIVPNIYLTDQWVQLAIVAIVFGLVNAFVRPIVKLFTLPLTIATLGLFTLVINTLMLLLVSWLNVGLEFTGSGVVQDSISAFLASIVITIVSTLLSWFLPD
ncbi:MAG: phage holin family protein [Anaerolineae bacterium]|nr:phage holin family protein [Anaerolineae bacterium]